MLHILRADVVGTLRHERCTVLYFAYLAPLSEEGAEFDPRRCVRRIRSVILRLKRLLSLREKYRKVWPSFSGASIAAQAIVVPYFTRWRDVDV